MKKNELLICAIAGNFVLCIIGIIIIPLIHGYTEMHIDNRRWLLVLTLAATAFIALIFLSCMGYFSGRKTNDQFAKEFAVCLKDSSKFAVFFVCIIFVYALICGAVASLIHMLFQEIIRYETIKQIVNIFTSITTVAIAPVMVMELLSFTFSSLSIKDAIRAGLAASRQIYFKFLLIEVVFLIIGIILSVAIGYIDNVLIKTTVGLIGYTIIGGIGTYIVYKIGIETYKTPREKRCEREY